MIKQFAYKNSVETLETRSLFRYTHTLSVSHTHKNTQLHSFLILHLKKKTYGSFHTYFQELSLEKDIRRVIKAMKFINGVRLRVNSTFSKLFVFCRQQVESFQINTNFYCSFLTVLKFCGQ